MKPTVKCLEEERKESSTPARFVAQAAKTVEEEVQQELSSFEKKQEGLPDKIKRKGYKWERDLLDDLEEFGLDEYRHVTLDSNGRAVWEEMESPEHQSVASMIQREFTRWSYAHELRVVAEKEPSLWVFRSFNNNAIRKPDMSLFGPSRLEENGSIRKQGRFPMNPHVVIEISLTSPFSKEQAAILDMMAFAGVGDYENFGRPNVAYLIDVLHNNNSPRAYDPVYGFNVYQVRQVDLNPNLPLTQDQLFPQNRPTLQYRVGGNEDDAITIAAQDLGLENSNLVFRVTFAQIRLELESCGVEFVVPPVVEPVVQP
eukprot:scaffold1749_cov54-Cylindrotheca_fusiformis.AAC.2